MDALIVIGKLVVLFYGLVIVYACWRLWLCRHDERIDAARAAYRGHVPPRPPPTNATGRQSPALQTGELSGHASVYDDHLSADPRPEWSWSPPKGRG